MRRPLAPAAGRAAARAKRAATAFPIRAACPAGGGRSGGDADLPARSGARAGGGTNLTYVDDEPVLAPRELEPLAHVQMGHTVLRFVPLCGPGFSWEDEPDDR